MPEATLAELGLHVGIWRWNSQSGQVNCSPYLLKMLGLDERNAPLPAAGLRDLILPADLPAVQAAMARHIEDSAPFEQQFRVRHADGHYLDLRCRGGFIDGTGPERTFVGIAVDVSAEQDHLRKLEASQWLLDDIARSVPGVLVRFVRRTGSDVRMEFVSSGSLEVWEIPPDTIMDGPNILREIVDAKDLARLDAAFARATETLSPLIERWRVQLRSGAVKFLELRARPRRQTDGSVVWSGVILDVSAEEQARQTLTRTNAMLVQSQKMEAIGRIAGGVAHDFNNLLAVILGNAELVKIYGTEDPNRGTVEEIVAACTKGADLTRRLLSFARQSKLTPETINLNEAVGSMSGMIRRIIPESITIETALLAGLWETKVDPSFIERSLLNLVINSRDAMPKGGRLTIETSNMRITADYAEDRNETIPPGRYVMLAVSDTGAGIPKELLDKVVEPFFSTKGPQMGSGLGLAVVDGFVRQSGGFLRIYSEVGRGTTVKLFFRAAEGAPARHAGYAASSAEPGTAFQARLLLVEDEPAVKRYLVKTLTAAGFEVIAVENGETGLDRFLEEADRIDLLLTDVVVPGSIQGPELARRLSALRPGLPVVFMSGYPNEAAIHGNSIRPSDRFLMKPVQRAELLRVLGEALERPK